MTNDSLAFPLKHNAFLMLNFCYYIAVFPRRTNCQRCSGSRVGCDYLSTIKHQTSDIKLRSRGFTLIELLVVMAIILILMALVAPAFTSLKSAGDVTSAAYTIKGVLDTARTYAKANNTYTWVGLYEEDVSILSPAPAGIGRVVMSVVASKVGTMIYNTSSPAQITTAQLIQVGKLTKIENVHLAGDALFTATPSTPSGSTFNNRPAVTYRIASPPNASPPDSTTPFQYPVGSPYTFRKMIEFSPGGEARIDNNSYALQKAAEIGLRATHGTTVDLAGPNVVAIQFGGIGANVRIYRK